MTSLSLESILQIEKGTEGVTDADLVRALGPDGDYEVTAEGVVFSTTRWRGVSRRAIGQRPNAGGYPSVRLVIANRRKHVAVHRLVALMHIGPRPTPEHQVRHLDGTKVNNWVANLAWGTVAENAQDRLRHGTDPAASNAAKSLRKRSGELGGNAILTDAEASAIIARSAAGVSIAKIALDYPHVSRDTVGMVVRRKTFKHLGVAS